MRKLTVRELDVVIEALIRAQADAIPDHETEDYPDVCEAALKKLQRMRAVQQETERKAEQRAIERQQQRNADRVDGYDRDDLGHSEDF